MFGTDNLRNAVHASRNEKVAMRELETFFNNPTLQPSAILNHCTLCMIKPHVVASGLAGKLVGTIMDEGFEISAMEMMHLKREDAEEFFDLYKGVAPDYASMIDQVISGPCILLEVRQEGAVEAFKEFAGHREPSIAKMQNPKSLRA